MPKHNRVYSDSDGDYSDDSLPDMSRRAPGMAEPEAGPSGPKPDEVCKEVCKFNVPSKDWWLKEPRACPFTGLSIGNLGRVKPKLHDEFRGSPTATEASPCNQCS